VALKLIKIKDKKIYLLGLIKGLTSTRKTVKSAVIKLKPDVIALYVSEGELLGLQSVLDGKTTQVPLSRYEEAYAHKLAYYAANDTEKYGEVQVPPPSLMEGLELGKKKDIPVVALDMDEKSYANTFVQNVSTTNLVRHSFRFKKLAKKKFEVTTPEEFTFAWDAELTKLKGFKNLEIAREQYMARRLLELKNKFSCVLAILELERTDGVFNHIKGAKRLGTPSGH
jgi:pheromone shutdown protein TraB